MTATKMSLHELKEAVGEELALKVALQSGKLKTEELPDTPTGWKLRYRFALGQSLDVLQAWLDKESFSAEDALAILDINWETWANRNSGGYPSKLERQHIRQYQEAAKKLQERLICHDDCVRAWEHIPSAGFAHLDIGYIILPRALELAQTPEHFQWIYNHAPHAEEIRKGTVVRLAEFLE